MDLPELPENATMRDIFDYCSKRGLHNLAQGMIELPPPKKLREIAAQLCIEANGIHQYRNRYGDDEYRIALSGLLNRHYKANVPKESILATSGVSGAIFSTLMTIRKERGEKAKIALIVPFYTYHQRQVQEVFGKDPEYILTNDDFSPNFENISTALKGGIDAIIFCNPGNPQGIVWKKEDLQRFVSMTSENNCILILDEIYSDLYWTDSFYTPPQDKLWDHVVVCRGFSKNLGCQSWRCGYAISSPSTIDRIMRIHDPIYISVSWTQHAIAKYVSEHYEDYVSHIQETKRVMRNNWELISKALEKNMGWIALKPEGSMYGMFRHNSANDRDAIALGLKAGIGVAPGNIFWPPTKNTGYIRIHCGMSETNAIEIVKSIDGKK